MKNAKKIEALEARKLEKVQAAKAVAAAADDEGRDLLPSERTTISGLIREAKSANEEIKTLKGDDQWQRELASLLGAAPGGGPSFAGAGGKVRPWAAPVMAKHLEAVQAKTLTPNGSINVPAPPTGLVATEDRPRNVLGLIASEPTAVDSFVYLREVRRDHNASTVKPGHRKPVSEYGVEKFEDRCRTVAHLSEPIPRQDLADSELLAQYLDMALRNGVSLTLEDQVINGDGDDAGVRDDLVGVRNTSGLQVQSFVSDVLTTARHAVTALELLNLPELAGVAWVLHPSTWAEIELLQSDEFFVLGGPGAGSGGSVAVDRAARKLWSYRVITSTVIEPGVGLLGDWSGSLRLRTREDVRVDWSEAPVDPETGATGFEKNLVTFRCEGRFGLEVLRPAAFVEVELAEGSGS